MSKKIVIFGIDNFSKKNVGQLECIIDNKFNLDVFTNDVLSNSVLNVQGKANVFLLNNSLKSRLIQIYKYLKNNASDIHHAEIYPGGRFAFVYVLFCKLFKVKMVAVERGDLIYYDRYDKLTKFAMRITYKYSDIIWYRELYMKEILQNEFTTHLVFLHNSINKNKIKIEKKEYNFLWVNRLISERKSNWFIDSLNKLKIEKNIMIGIMNTSDNENYALENQNTFLQVMKYQDPKDYYLKSKFFVLPSDLAY